MAINFRHVNGKMEMFSTSQVKGQGRPHSLPYGMGLTEFTVVLILGDPPENLGAGKNLEIFSATQLRLTVERASGHSRKCREAKIF